MFMSVYVHACTHADTHIILHSFISRLSIYWYIQTFIHRTHVILGVLYILKKTEGQRIDVFKLWCWRRLLRAPWPAKQSNQSILKDINPEYSLEGLITIAPKHWPPDVKRRLIGKDPDAEKYWRQEEKGTTEDVMVGWHHWFNGHEFEQTLGDNERQGSLASVHGVTKSWIGPSNWTASRSFLFLF